MSANDKILLKNYFDTWSTKRAGTLKGIQPWLYFGVDQILKSYAFDDAEVQAGFTDGGADGGADAIYFVVNQRQLVMEEKSVVDAANVSKIRLIFVQSKTSGGFQHTEIEKLLATTEDFLDLPQSPDSFGERYNKNVLRLMRAWRAHYLKISGVAFPEVTIDYYYFTGDDVVPNDVAKDSGERVLAIARKQINAKCEFHYIGAEQLWSVVQHRPPKQKVLTWSGTPMETEEGFVGLTTLKTLSDFISEDGVLAERIFESNVRGFQAETGVNKKILASLKDASSAANFWMLNNGITIVSPLAAKAGVGRIAIDDPQIVNGLQTSRLIHAYCNSPEGKANTTDKRTVLVRVIQAVSPDLQDQIVQATNSQTKMAPASLRMTDQIHRNIEDYFKSVDLFYDRRKGYYKDKGMPITKIISVTEVLQAAISVLLQRPDDARARPGDYFKDDDKYDSVFGENVPLSGYLACVQIVRRVEAYLESVSADNDTFRNLRFYIAAYLSRELTGMPKPVASHLPEYADIDKLEDSAIKPIYDLTRKLFEGLIKKEDKDSDTIARGPTLLKAQDANWKRRQKKLKDEKAKMD